MPGRCPYLTERGTLSSPIVVGLGVLVTFHAVAVPGEDNNTFDVGHFASMSLVVEKVVRRVGDGLFHGG